MVKFGIVLDSLFDDAPLSCENNLLFKDHIEPSKIFNLLGELMLYESPLDI